MDLGLEGKWDTVIISSLGYVSQVIGTGALFYSQNLQE